MECLAQPQHPLGPCYIHQKNSSCRPLLYNLSVGNRLHFFWSQLWISQERSPEYSLWKRQLQLHESMEGSRNKPVTPAKLTGKCHLGRLLPQPDSESKHPLFAHSSPQSPKAGSERQKGRLPQSSDRLSIPKVNSWQLGSLAGIPAPPDQ